MKRDGYIIEEIIARSNLEESFDTVVRGTLRKSLKEGKWLLAHREEFLDEVAREIESGHINLSGYHSKVIFEGGKYRNIQVFNMKDRYHIKHFYRYCDDGLIGSSQKLYLWACRGIVHERIEAIGQTVKANDRVFPVSEGLDFLGYVIYPTHSLLRKRVKKTYCRKLARVKSRKRRQQIVGSLYGMAKHADCQHLLETVLFPSEINRINKKRIRQMRKFSELGINYEPKDGKKRFHGKTVRLGAIVNNEIEIHDYERDVKTSHGDNRYLVSFKDARTGEMGKFFTNSEEMKSQLDSASDIEDGFPFATTIRSECFENGKGFRYFFT